jgi:hypothetical protein
MAPWRASLLRGAGGAGRSGRVSYVPGAAGTFTFLTLGWPHSTRTILRTPLRHVYEAIICAVVPEASVHAPRAYVAAL